MTGSKRKAAKSPTISTSPLDDRILADPAIAPSMAAAHYVAEHGCSFARAAKRHGVTKQAVADAFRRAYSVGPRKVGRPPSGRPLRTHSISTDRVNLRASDVELAAYRRAAGDRPLAEWLREVCGPPPRWRRIHTPEMRRLARAAAGLPEE